MTKIKKKTDDVLKDKIFTLVKKYYDSVHKPYLTKEFIPSKDKINYAGRVFDEKEMINLVDSALDFWLTAGKYAEEFERKLANFFGVRYCLLVNSGSSANLLAFAALTSSELGERSIKRGDEVITVAAAFPTTIAPIIHYGAIPVFVDISLPTYNIDVSKLEYALSDKTKAIFLAHTLGNPFDLKTVKEFCDRHNLWLIEDNCDALGSRYFYNGEWRYTGTFGDIRTSSFYPPHHITMGEGGAVYTNNPELKRILLSMRDWGRDCWCASGKDNTCGKRFDWQLGELPYGYDHKYIYSHFGYNLKATDMQAAIGVAQLEKLPSFIEARKRNWKMLREGLDDLSDIFILPEPAPDSDPSWFGFLLTVKEDAGFTRDNIVNHLEANGIQTRMLFAGNLLRHPCFNEMRKTGEGYRVLGDLTNTNRIMKDTFWVGVYPGLTETMIEYMIESVFKFVRNR
jgi:CDP-6-deoxy-D-xylo-4-hexulose-3-dehydrase